MTLPAAPRLLECLVLCTATGSSVDRSDMARLTAFKPVTDFCRHVRGVIDLSWFLLGPGATSLSAGMGAEGVRLEPAEPARGGMARYVPPFIQDIPGPSG